MKTCIDCKKKLYNVHFNTKRCPQCVSILRRRPLGTMTEDQIEIAKSLAGTLDRRDIAEKLGVSLSNLKRSCRDIKFNYHNKYKANPGKVKELCEFYEKNGRVKTQEKYPDWSVRSVVERYKLFTPRQRRWENSEIIEAIKMGGLVSFENQAKYFNRPNDNAGLS